MSFDKQFEEGHFGKERRKPYYGAKAIDPSCRNHGSDEWELGNRKHKIYKRMLRDQDYLDDDMGYKIHSRREK